MSERRGTVMLIQRGDPEITGANVEEIAAARGTTLCRRLGLDYTIKDSLRAEMEK